MALELFKPPDNGVGMLDEYPELGEIDEFRGLTNDNDLLFAYYMGCPSSPYFTSKKKDIKQKRTVCFTKVFGDTADELKTKYINGTYPESLRVAIERFERFRPSARMRAKVMVDRMFDMYESATVIDDSEQELISSDPEEMRKYVDNTKKIMDQLPKLIQMKEHGFGITEKGELTEDTGATLYDLATE